MQVSFDFSYICPSFDVCQSQHVSLKPGFYLFELWGGAGGIGRTNGVLKYSGGKGSYTSGSLVLLNPQTFYLYIGGKGGNGSSTSGSKAKGGWNGGGQSGADTNDNDGSGGGGGATDIRLVGGSWNSIESLVSRVMVAAGGSGSVYNNYGAPGGDLSGYITTNADSSIFSESTTNQTNGNSLGAGGNGINHALVPSSGGGGGFYGGFSSQIISSPYFLTVSSSGSSYISGHHGCNSVDENGQHTGSPKHYSGFFFGDSIIHHGHTEFLSPNGAFELGHSGNGAIRITLLKPFLICVSENLITIRNFVFFFIFLLESF